MVLSVRDAAQRLGHSPAEVRRLLSSGFLRGRHLGTQWVVDEDDLARVATHVRRRGRPMSGPRAWALLWILDGAAPHWLPPVARSQVRARAAELVHADADRWRSLLRARAQVHRFQAHPAALPRLLGHRDAVVAGGAGQAADVGIDLVALDPVPEVYVRASELADLSGALHMRPTTGPWNLLVRVPDPWPFSPGAGAGAAVVAADLLDSAEPRAVAAGAQVLRDLAVKRAR